MRNSDPNMLAIRILNQSTASELSEYSDHSDVNAHGDDSDRFRGSEQGQGLLELVIALGLLVTGMTVALTLSLANASAGREAEARAVAANLSREGIEVVQHIRFSNIDLSNLWDTNLAAGSYALIFDPTNTTTPWRLDAITTGTTGNQELLFQNVSTGGLLGLRLQGVGTGTKTGFLRTITIVDICNDGTNTCNSTTNPKVGIDVTSSVTWKGGGRHTVSAGATYYHWQ